MVSASPKLAISKHPGAMTAGIWALVMASILDGPAESVAPVTSSAHSVVVRSSMPLTIPVSMRSSIVLPPAPVAWNTRTS